MWREIEFAQPSYNSKRSITAAIGSSSLNATSRRFSFLWGIAINNKKVASEAISVFYQGPPYFWTLSCLKTDANTDIFKSKLQRWHLEEQEGQNKHQKNKRIISTGIEARAKENHWESYCTVRKMIIHVT